jgi:DNA gyrase subunit A
MPKEKPQKKNTVENDFDPSKNNGGVNNTGINVAGFKSILPVSIVDEMKSSYLDYAMSVITSRALPDVRDGLKPVHRRILFSMYENGLTASAKFKKSAFIVGDVLGKYHPHGDASVYDAMVNLAQPFSTRYPLVFGQGNFGSIDGDSQAAMRYTEARMSKIAMEMMRDINKETVNFAPNYDGTRKEPTVMPTVVPQLLLNGTLGIAVGMATNMAPHNLREVVDATVHMIDNPDATTEDLMDYVQGPDFPIGGIAYNKADILRAYSTGRGGVVTRGEAEIVETKSGQFNIIISSIPYRVVKQNMVTAIAELVHEKKLEGIKDMRDESTDEIRVVIELKNGVAPERVLNYLYKHTQLEQTFHFNMVALVDGVPQTLSLASLISNFILHRETVVRLRTEYDLRKAKEREHILLGLKKALDHIDKVISIIRASKDAGVAKVNLMKEFKFSELQTNAILEMRLQKLAGLERKAIELELKDVQDFIKECESILASRPKMLKIIKDELNEIKEKYGDDRRTKIVKGGLKSVSDEDLIPNKENVLVYTKGGYVKRTDPSEYRAQKRGGVGVIDIETKDEDFVTMLVSANTHSDLLFFTNLGKAYQIKMYDIPEGKKATKGKSIMNFLSITQNESITSILPISKENKDSVKALVLVTKLGDAKKVSASSFKDVRRSGIISIKLAVGDELVAVLPVTDTDEVVIVSTEGQSIRFKESDIREMGRSAGGVRAMKLDKTDFVVGVDVIKKGQDKGAGKLLTMSANGLGKQTELSEYKVQKRGGSGIKTAKVTQKTGNIIIAKVITEQEELIAVSQKGQIIRTSIESVPTLGRDTQGVTVMKLRAGDTIASFTCL